MAASNAQLHARIAELESKVASLEAQVEVLSLGERCADLFEVPVDVEWAWTGQRAWLLQCRPATRVG